MSVFNNLLSFIISVLIILFLFVQEFNKFDNKTLTFSIKTEIKLGN